MFLQINSGWLQYFYCAVIIFSGPCDNLCNCIIIKYIITFFFFQQYLFIWLHKVLAAAWELLVAACGIQFPDRDRTQAPCIRSMES